MDDRPWPPAPATSDDVPQAATGWVLPTPKAPSRFRSSATRARFAVAALLAVLLVDAVEILHVSAFEGLLAAYLAGTIDTPEIDNWDQWSLTIDRIYLVVFLLCGITFLAWLSRAVDNAPSLGAGVPPRSPRGAILWWFVPFANLVVPYQIVSDLARRLATQANQGPTRPLVAAWWVSYLFGNLFAYVPVVLLMGESLEELRLGLTMTVVSNLFDIVAAVLVILVIYKIQGREDARAAGIALGSAPAVDVPAAT